MGVFHSIDIRKRLVSMVDGGQSRRAAARHFGISASAAIKLLQHRKAAGTVAPCRQGRPPGSGKLAAYLPFLIATIEAKPDMTMPELADRLDDAHGIRVTAPWIVDAAMNSRIFETWIETQLAPTLSPGDVVILDNVGFHKSERAEQLVKQREPGFSSCHPIRRT
jgi:transposase